VRRVLEPTHLLSYIQLVPLRMERFIFFFLWLSAVLTQYPEDSGLFNETYIKGEKVLRESIEADPDVEYIIYPEREMIDISQYHFIEPQAEDYTIGLLIDPVSRLHLRPSSSLIISLFCFPLRSAVICLTIAV
jgi:hypothetical protein